MRTAGVAYEGDNDSVKEVFKQYEKLTKKSGLVLNADKTKILHYLKSTWCYFDY